MSLSLTRLDGSTVLSISKASARSESVAFLRRVVAENLGQPVNQVSLWYGESELVDDSKQLVHTFKEAASEPVVVNVITRPCSARPDEYDQYIVRGVIRAPSIYKPGEYAICVAEGMKFPEPQDININMMPFVIGQKDSLPKDCRQYWPLIEACNVERAEQGKIGFLTIQESMVEAGTSQRRPGLHVDATKVVMKHHGELMEIVHPWGISMGYEKRGGLYMGSNVSRSTRIWDCLLRPPERVVGVLGDVEHLRDDLGEGTLMESGELWWITDITPHESLPLEETAYRQYFRVVTSGVGVWYAKHSTANPLGVQPDPAVTKTSMHDKFLHLADCQSIIDSFSKDAQQEERLQRFRSRGSKMQCCTCF